MTRKLALFIVAIFGIFILNSCSNDVDIFAEGDEVTVVYGYLDVDADTNYLKITKSFLGNALELAPDYSASNYDYKLDVKLIGKFASNPVLSDTVTLDTTSVFKPYDPDGIFYSGRDQVLYYTTAKLIENQEYQLLIKRKDGKVVTSKVKTIYGSTIKKPWASISFEPSRTSTIEWRSKSFNQLAAYYEVVGYFHYGQIDLEHADTTYHKMRWYLGSGTGEELYNGGSMNMSLSYVPKTFYSKLAADPNIINNTDAYTERFVKYFEIVVTAVGKELYNYILIQNSNSAIMDTPEYTNIENGIGVWSSRSVCSQKFTVSGHTINTLIYDYPEWGFKYN